MKRYLVFGGTNYAPSGGWDDFLGDFDTLEEAKKASAPPWGCEWKQIVDTDTQGCVDNNTPEVINRLADGTWP